MAYATTFPTRVNVQPAIGVEGDFASANPRASLLSGAGAFVAGAAGLTVGRFAWIGFDAVDDLGAGAVLNNFGAGPVDAFIRRSQQALITNWLDGASLVIPPGMGVGDAFSSGDFLARNAGAVAAVPGMKAYANLSDGSVTFGATGIPTIGATSSSSTIAQSTITSVVGHIVGNVLTVESGSNVHPGATISGTGVTAGTKILKQLTGTSHGVGTYSLSLPSASVPAGTAITGTFGTLTVGGTVAGTFAVGQLLGATGSVAAGTRITEVLTGGGGAGTYVVDNNTLVAGAQEIDVAAINVETKWFARSFAVQGELVKISDQPLG